MATNALKQCRPCAY